MDTPPYFSTTVTKGNNFCDLVFFSKFEGCDSTVEGSISEKIFSLLEIYFLQSQDNTEIYGDIFTVFIWL